MSDLISREKIKKIVKRMESIPWCDEKGNLVDLVWTSEMLEYLIDKLPSVEPRWIPATERLPDEEGLYVISHKNGRVYLDKWLGDDGWRFYNTEIDAWMAFDAWLAFPEPYKEAQE